MWGRGGLLRLYPIDPGLNKRRGRPLHLGRVGGWFGDRRCHIVGDGHAPRLQQAAYGRDFSGYESEDDRGKPCSEDDITGARDMWGAEDGTGR